MNCGLRHFGNDVMQLSKSRIRQAFGSALPLQTSLTQTKPVLPLSNEHGSQVKDQGRWQCYHNKHKKFPYQPTQDVSLLSWHTSYMLDSPKATLILTDQACSTVCCHEHMVQYQWPWAPAGFLPVVKVRGKGVWEPEISHSRTFLWCFSRSC